MSGYQHRAYAESLREFGTPIALKQCEGWLLARTVPQTNFRDGMGCYPLFACRDWGGLKKDLEQLAGDLGSICMVADPFGDFDEDLLRECFPDLVKPFKQHFVTDLEESPETFVHPHHRRNVKKALKYVEIERCVEPLHLLDDWCNLYQTIIQRHAITGISAFSRNSFHGQLAVPGIVAFRALEQGTTVGMMIWYRQGDRAYYHLGAFSQRGYEVGVSFALFDKALRYFRSQQLRWLDLGGEAGSSSGSSNSGLARFKRGWSNGVRTAYLCGRILSHSQYKELVAKTNTGITDYFPAYRLGEFE